MDRSMLSTRLGIQVFALGSDRSPVGDLCDFVPRIQKRPSLSLVLADDFLAAALLTAGM
jgi:hypothetical protein